jgi:hypothetical protein
MQRPSSVSRSIRSPGLTAAADTQSQDRSAQSAPRRKVAARMVSGMEPSLLRLMEELLVSIEQRDSDTSDAPRRDALIRVQRLEEELARRLRNANGGSMLQAPDCDEELVRIA